ncbi:MAG TPA: GNAT family N-acetyltransferase [Pseudonocardiaceae bacterium]|nr:GNAT family N-acetyltransferase [Pseudonocardiaceae bacterium]
MTDATIAVRAWQPAVDLARLVDVSMAADVLFADYGLSLPPDDPTDELLRAEHVLVAGSPAVGFAEINTVDGRAHLAGLAVHPAYGRRGIGGRLLAAACEVAVEAGHTAMTLTTFVEVPWNAPWYAARGFTELPAESWGSGLQAVWAAEQAAGIIVAPRVVMTRQLTG